VVGFTTGSRGKVPGKTCEKRIRNNKNNNNKDKAIKYKYSHYAIISINFFPLKTLSHTFVPVFSTRTHYMPVGCGA
jgi:hypothetical protein